MAGKHAAEEHQGGHGIGHVAPARILIGTGALLLVLTWVTVFAAGIDLGEMNIWIALAIAAIKASFVALFFMHLRWDRPFNAVIFVSSIVFVTLFISLAITDTAEYQDTLNPGDAPKVQAEIDLHPPG